MMRKLLTILVLIAVVSVAIGQQKNKKPKNNSKFARYAKEFKKDYKNKSSGSIDRAAERVLRRKNKIDEINNDPESTFKADHTEWDDLTSEERESRLCGTRLPHPSAEPLTEDDLLTEDDEPVQPTYRALPAFNTFSTTTAPAAKDWTSSCLGVVDQKTCGCCWSFATMSMLECYNRIRYGNASFPNLLSPQFLVDCDNTNNGCNGGWPKAALDKLKTSFATSAPTWANYAYTSGSYQTNPVKYVCKSSVTRVKLNYINTYQRDLNGDENALKLIIANYGPVVAAVYTSSSFFNYKSGIFYDSACPIGNATATQCSKVSHAVVITGYGRVNNTDVWIVKNSWGTTWGIKGYMYMSRNRGNNCNPACHAFYVD